MLPRIAARILLKSWAIPPARVPRDSSFFSFSRSCSILCSSVTSRKTKTTPMTSLFLSRIGAQLAAIFSLPPSQDTSIIWLVGSTICPVAITFCTGFSHDSPVTPLIRRNTSANGRPWASLRDHPVISSAARFSRVIKPSLSVEITPSPILRRVTTKRSRSSASASADFFVGSRPQGVPQNL